MHNIISVEPPNQKTHGCCWAPFLYQILTKHERRASFHSNKCHQTLNKYAKDEPDINLKAT